MANYCENYLTLNGDDDFVKKIWKEILNKEEDTTQCLRKKKKSKKG